MTLEEFRATRRQMGAEDAARATSGDDYGVGFEDNIENYAMMGAWEIFVYTFNGRNVDIVRTSRGYEWCWPGKGGPDFEPTLGEAEAKALEWVSPSEMSPSEMRFWRTIEGDK